MNQLFSAGWQLVLTQLWQVSLLIAVVAGLVKVFARNRPHLACGLWFVVALKCVTPPIWCSTSGLFCWIQPTTVETTQTESSRTVSSIENQSEFDDLTPLDVPAIGTQLRAQFALINDRNELDEPSVTALDSDPNAETTTAESRSLLTQNHLSANHEDATWQPLVETCLAIVWGAGSFCWLSILLWRLHRCRQRWNEGADREHPIVVPLVNQLRQQLGISQVVRVLVTPHAVGPAVIGIFRPTIILPQALVEGQTVEALAPLLAHELIHVRRGDLWIGLLQTIAVCVWWFHPLVRIASRGLSREAERCCDEEVLAELHCDPATYARSLLHVLEFKSQLMTVPAFPGVRPLEVTTSRLERIMHIGQGGYRRAPLWCRLAVVILAIGVLPGAAFAWRQPPADPVPQPVPGASPRATTADPAEVVSPTPPAARSTPLPWPARDATVPAPQPRSQQPQSPDSEYPSNAAALRDAARRGDTVRKYFIGDLVEKLHQESGEALGKPMQPEVERAHRAMLFQFYTSLFSDAGAQSTPNAAQQSPQPSDPNLRATQANPVENKPEGLPVVMTTDSIVVAASDERHREIEQLMESCRKFGFTQYIFDVQMVSVPLGTARHLGLSEIGQSTGGTDPGNKPVVNELPDGANPLDPPASNKTGQRDGAVTQLDEAGLARLKKAIAATPKSQVRMSPRLVTFNGQTAVIESMAERPFVVGERVDAQGRTIPEIQTFKEGVWIQLRPTLVAKDRLHVKLTAGSSSIREAASVATSDAENKEQGAIQTPSLEKAEVQTTLEMPSGKTSVIRGLTLDTLQAEPTELLLIVSAQEVEPETTRVATPASAVGPAARRGTLSDHDGGEEFVVKTREWRIVLKSLQSEGGSIRMVSDAQGRVYEATGGAKVELWPAQQDNGGIPTCALRADELVLRVSGKTRNGNETQSKRVEVVAKGNVTVQKGEGLRAYCDKGHVSIEPAAVQASPTAEPTINTRLILEGNLRMIHSLDDGRTESVVTADRLEMVISPREKSVRSSLPTAEPVPTPLTPPKVTPAPDASRRPTPPITFDPFSPDTVPPSGPPATLSEPAQPKRKQPGADGTAPTRKRSPANNTSNTQANPLQADPLSDDLKPLADQRRPFTAPVITKRPAARNDEAQVEPTRPPVSIPVPSAGQPKSLTAPAATRRPAEQDNESDPILITYSVGDLIVAPGAVTIKKNETRDHLEVENADPLTDASGLETLSQMIMQTVSPDSWSDDQGLMIREHKESLSLVVRHHANEHQKIRDLLSQLRKLQELQVALDIRKVETTTDVLLAGAEQSQAKSIALFARQVGGPFAIASKDAMQRVLADLPRDSVRTEAVDVSVQYGQSVSILGSVLGKPLEDIAGRVRLLPVAAASVSRLTLKTNLYTEDVHCREQTLDPIVRFGDSIILDLTAWAHDSEPTVGIPILSKLPDSGRLFIKARSELTSQRTYLIVTPRIVVKKEVEQPLRR